MPEHYKKYRQPLYRVKADNTLSALFIIINMRLLKFSRAIFIILKPYVEQVID